MKNAAKPVRNTRMWKETIYRAASPDATRFAVEAAGVSVCDETYRIKRRQSGMHIFEYVYQGGGVVRVNGITCRPRAGDVYILPAGSNHEYHTEGTGWWRKVWFTANGPLLGQLLGAYRLEEVYHVPGCDQKALFFQMFATVKDQGPDLQREGALLFHRLCINLERHRGLGDSALPLAAVKAKQYLDANLRHPVRIEDVGRHIYKSPSQVIRIFKQAYGKTPYEYLVEQRVETAKMLLANHAYLSVKEVAYSLNYADEHYFSSHFKARVGMSPTAYKKMIPEQSHR